MHNIWFTADQHFWHKSIIRHCNRPFPFLTQMHRALIDNFNAVVTNKDHIYHLGDFAFINNVPMVKKIFKELNGKKHYIIPGNHDRWLRKLKREGESIYRLEILEPIHELKWEGQRITLCHYAMLTWPAAHRGSWCLYGHSHGNLKPEKGRLMDVGVDSHNFYPISFNQVKEYMATRIPWEVDHHREEKGNG